MAEHPPSCQQTQVLSTQTDDGFLPPLRRNIHKINEILDLEDSEDYTDPSSWAVLKLPQYILLKGDNEMYLRTTSSGINVFSADNKMDGTIFEVVTLSDGAVGIRSSFNDKFLGIGLSFIAAAFTAADLEDNEKRFWPIKMGRGTHTNLIGLRLFESRFFEASCFRADVLHFLAYAIGFSASNKSRGFEVEEAVSRRQIYGVQYHMADARIYDHEPLTSVTKDVKNWSATPQKGVLSFSHTESESQTWGSTDSWKISASVGISVRIPFIAETDITTEAYYSGACEWGEAQETAKEIASQLEVEIPPKSMVQATMIVQKGKLEVPFSYGQTDATFDGRTVSSNLPDGLFTGVNTYVTFHTIKRSL